MSKEGQERQLKHCDYNNEDEDTRPNRYVVFLCKYNYGLGCSNSYILWISGRNRQVYPKDKLNKKIN